MPIKLSFSKISSYIDCQRKYFLSYICDMGTGESPHMANGSALHKCCEDFVDWPEDKQTYDNLLKYYYEILPEMDEKNLVHESIDGEVIINPIFEEKAIKSLKSFYEDYMENAYQQKETGRYAFQGPNREKNKPNIILQEEWFNIKTKDGHEIRGLIDRVDQEPEGEHIIDYKSGQTRTPYKSLQDPLDVKSLQLSIYALARYKETGKIPYKSSFFYIEPAKGRKVQKGEYRTAPKRSLEQLEKVEEFLNNIGNEIEEKLNIQKETGEDAFPMNDNANCFFCDFKNQCEILAANQITELNNSLNLVENKKDISIDNSIWNDE